MNVKKPITKTDLIFEEKVIKLRSVYDKADIKYYILPCRDKYGKFPPCVKRVDSNNNMILSEKEKDAWSEGRAAFIPENQIFIIQNGKTYNLDDIYDKAEWEAIKNCPLIAPSRDARDSNGNLIIDGAKSTPTKPSRNGVAELYIDRPGLDTQRRVSRKQLVHKACSYIYDDPQGADGQLKMARILGKNMFNQPIADVIDFLVRRAEENPERIIELYSGDEANLRLIFMDAKDKKVIYIKNKLYMYGDNIILGATDDAVITWMKDPKNKRMFDLITKDTYPDYYPEEKEIK